MARLPGLRVIRSPIDGFGVVATRRFAKGSVITNVEGVLWRAGEVRDDTWSLVLEDGVFFDMVDQTRWVNHSCEPNVVVEAGVTRAGNGWAQLQALWDIAPGDELTYDYAFDAHLAVPCRCGAPTCRGWIIAPGHSPPAGTSSSARSRSSTSSRSTRGPSRSPRGRASRGRP
jgi:uncharacterized protein